SREIPLWFPNVFNTLFLNKLLKDKKDGVFKIDHTFSTHLFKSSSWVKFNFLRIMCLLFCTVLCCMNLYFAMSLFDNPSFIRASSSISELESSGQTFNKFC